MLKQIICMFIIITSSNIIEARRGGLPIDMRKQVNHIKNHCNRYAKMISNISNNIENTTYCKNYFMTNVFYNVDCIKNCTSDTILYNFNKTRYECINTNMNELSTGVSIAFVIMFIMSICCLMSSEK